jgi:hypothetical protein
MMTLPVGAWFLRVQMVFCINPASGKSLRTFFDFDFQAILIE